MILQKPIPSEHYEILFPTFMGRSLLISTTIINGKSIKVATSHLESMNDNHKLRYEQLMISYDYFKDFNNIIMMGDFNFDNSKENKTNI